MLYSNKKPPIKTKTTILKPLFFTLLIITFLSCKKSTTTNPVTNTGPLNGTWAVSAWGGVNGNPLAFVANTTPKTGVVTQVGSQPFGFAVGDQLFSNITVSGTGTYTCTGKYTYGANNSTSGTRAANLSLQNNGTQLTADYPAISSSFPEIIYIYQKQ